LEADIYAVILSATKDLLFEVDRVSVDLFKNNSNSLEGPRMSCFARNRWGHSIRYPDEAVMRELLTSVSADDPEHPDVSLNQEDGWALSYMPSHTIIFENVETNEGPWHMKNISIERALDLWKLLAQGDLAELKKTIGLKGIKIHLD
jgi:hypothetical protein